MRKEAKDHRFIHAITSTVLAFRYASADFVKTVTKEVIAPVQPIDVATNAGTRIVQSTIGDTARPATAGQVSVRRIFYISLESRIANDLSKRVNTTLAPSAEQGVCLKSVGQTPDHFLR